MINEYDKNAIKVIVDYIKSRYKIPMETLCSSNREVRIMEVRKTAMILMVYFRDEMSLQDVAEQFNLKHANLVAHIKNHDNAMVDDKEYREKFEKDYNAIASRITKQHLPLGVRLGDFTRIQRKYKSNLGLDDFKGDTVNCKTSLIDNGKVCKYRPLIIQGSLRCDNCMFNRFSTSKSGISGKKCTAISHERAAYIKGQDDLQAFGDALNRRDNDKVVELIEPVIATMQMQGTAVIDGLRKGARLAKSTYYNVNYDMEEEV